MRGRSAFLALGDRVGEGILGEGFKQKRAAEEVGEVAEGGREKG